MRCLSCVCVLFVLYVSALSAKNNDDRDWVQAIKYSADQIDFSKKDNKIIGEGNVKVEHEGMVLTAEKVVINLKQKQAFAEGDVHLVKGDKEFHGENILYNFVSKEVQVNNTRMEIPPWYAFGELLHGHPEGQMEITRAFCTTCDLDNPHWRLSTKNLVIYPGDRIVAKNVVVWVGGIPIFYWPYYAHSLKDRRGKFIFVPGQGSDWGSYVLAGYRYKLGDEQEGTVRVDYRQKKGFGYGLDHEYHYKDKQGLLRVYYLNERDSSSHPIREDERFRTKWVHKQNYTDNLWSVLEWHELSDENVIKDYVKKEFENNPKPESYFYMEYSMPRSNLSLLAKKQTNEFFDTVEYKPQVTYKSSYINFGDLPLYFKTEVDLASISKKFRTVSNSTTRLDIKEEFSYSKKIGFVGVRPYVGTQQTYYNHDLQDLDEVRGTFFTGLILNTKLYKSWDYENKAWDIHGLRVVHEPIIEYRLQDEPTVSKDRLEQFDRIDALREENYVQFRIENRLQTRRFSKEGSESWNLIQHRAYVNYYLEGSAWGGSSAKRDISQFFQEIKIRPYSWLTLDVDSIFDTYEKHYDVIKTDLFLNNLDKNFRFSLGHYYRRGLSNEITSSVRFRVGDKWKMIVGHNYNFNEHFMSRQEYTVLRDLHCWRVAVTYAHKKDTGGSENEFWVSFQLKAFAEDAYDFSEVLQGEIK